MQSLDTLSLDALRLNAEAIITSVDWSALGEREARRLRELGFDEGVAITALHTGGLWAHDPIAVRIGRMMVALRRAQAACISVAITS